MEFNLQRESNIPIYIQLKNVLAEKIGAGEYAALSPLPNIKIIAEKAGVSIRTADLALLELVKEGICFRRPKKGTFVRSAVAKQPVCGIWTDCDAKSSATHPLPNLFYSRLLADCSQLGITPVMLTGNPTEVIQRYDRSGEFDFRGIMVLDRGIFENAVGLAKNFPDKQFFFLNYFLNSLDCMPNNMTAIINDDYAGAYQLVEYFMASGTEHFMTVSLDLGEHDFTYVERVRGFRQAAADYSLELPDEDVLMLERHPHSTNQRKSAFLAVKRALRSGRCPEVILCVNDMIASGAKQAIISENLTGIQVAGYDYLLPELSAIGQFVTMQVPYANMAQTALHLLNSPSERREKILKLLPKLLTSHQLAEAVNA